MPQKIQRVFVILCLIALLACRSEAYTYASPSSKPQARSGADERDDPYLTKLLSQFPEHKKIISKLYDSYSGWIIDLTEKYGEAPLLAMNEAKEDEYNSLFKEPDVFIELYQAISSVKSKPKRAYLALRLANAMSLTDPAQDYAAELERAKAADGAASLRGKPSHRYMDAFFAKGIFPDNLLSELRKKPEKFSVLLDAFAEADAAVLESIAKYPNALAFLLNAGTDGIKLISETEGEIVTLSYIMTNESQAELPALFKKYRQLAKAIASCGANVFPVIMEAPEFYFALAASFRGGVYNRYYVAYAVLDDILKAGTAAGISQQDLLNGLSRQETRRIAGLTAELLEINNSSSESEMAYIAAPFRDPYYIQFVKKYDRSAADICAEFGELDMASMLMRDWQGGSRDVSPIISAILEYNDDNAWGLEAARTFRYAEHMQNIIFFPDFHSRTKELLMLMFYDLSMYLSANIARDMESAQKLLDDYRAESGTGKPISKDGEDVKFREFVPGYDLTKPIYDMVRYGKTPTIGDLAFAAADIASVVTITVGAGALIKSISTGVIKKVPGYIAKTVVVKTIKNIPSVLTGAWDDAVSAIRKLTLRQLRSQLGSMIDDAADAIKLSKADIWALSSKLMPNADTLSDLWNTGKKFAGWTKSGIVSIGKPIAEWADDLMHLYPSLRSHPWMTKRAAEAVVNGIVVESVLQPALFYTGVLSISNYIDSKQIPMKITK